MAGLASRQNYVRLDSVIDLRNTVPGDHYVRSGRYLYKIIYIIKRSSNVRDEKP